MTRLDLTPLWWLLILLGVAVLPWHAQGHGFAASDLLALFSTDVANGSALNQALMHHRWWLWPVLVAAMLPALGLARQNWLGYAGVVGLAAIVLQAATIGLRGWTMPWLNALFGELADRQPGIGLGAVATFIGFLFLFTGDLARRGLFGGDRFIAGTVGFLATSIALFTAWPVLTLLGRGFAAPRDGSLVDAILVRMFAPKIWSLACVTGGGNCGVAWNSILLAVATASACTLLGLAFALIVTRTGFRYRKALRLLTILPIITPSFVVGLGLILIFGRSGVINQALEFLFGIEPGRWIYGFNGVWLAQTFSFTPTAFLVLIGVVAGVSPSMEEASETLRAAPMRTFLKVSLPLMLPGIVNAFLVTFIESLADFGNPILLAGSFGVLSTEIFFAVVGAQADFGRAASLALILLVFAVAVFLLQRAVVGRKSYVSMTGKGDSGRPAALPRPMLWLASAVVGIWATLTIAIYLLALAGGFVTIWGRDWTFTLGHFAKAFAIDWGINGQLIWSGGAWDSLFTTVTLAAIAAPLTAAIGILAAWVVSRQRFVGRQLLEFALMLSFCVPGTVIGVAYILTFNVPPLEVTGTAIILILCFVFRNLPVGVRAGIAALSQVDKSLDEASSTLRASTGRTMFRVVLPLIRPAIFTALVYSFVRAITTVSAVIFLVSAEHELATVYIINRAINGDYGLAIAYCTVLVAVMMTAVGCIHLLVGERKLGRRDQPQPILTPSMEKLA
ncbi:iron ABC transporter permease [Devosia oryziradicis]|uniref:Iron ABC transporter permease n=1 Tax=Devosia oryziradicis TaxID=2801335 RepID=A0ABX7BXQ7_9HYPH|nr:iron ABC transporter permease [Devosia oryziradicis]QQR36738.1 iron ABC transporter permease [Devosia oryziradicis]